MCLHSMQLTWKLGIEEFKQAGRKSHSCQAIAQLRDSGKVSQKEKSLQPSTSSVLQAGGERQPGDRREQQQPDQLDISTSDVPSHLQLCCSHHRLLQSTLCEQRSCTDNIHTLHLFNLVLSLSTLGLNKSLALKSFIRSKVKDDGTSSPS